MESDYTIHCERFAQGQSAASYTQTVHYHRFRPNLLAKTATYTLLEKEQKTGGQL